MFENSERPRPKPRTFKKLMHTPDFSAMQKSHECHSGSPNLHSLFSCQTASLAPVRKQKTGHASLLDNGDESPLQRGPSKLLWSEHSPREPVS